MAESEQIQWLNGQANVANNVEKICPKRHITQSQWQSQWNEMYRSQPYYDYISDYECIFNHPIDAAVKYFYIDCDQERWDNLQAAKQKGTKVSITNLAHFTTPDAAEAIVESGRFIGGLKKINEDPKGHDVKAKFSWWSPTFTKDDIKQVRDSLGAAIQPFLHQHHRENGDQVDDQDTLRHLQNQFATSDAFRPNSRRYGSFYFQYGINDLCQQYSKHFDGEVQFKILGTFGYKKEVMHAVLVCSQANGTGPLFEEYPPVLTPEEDVNNDAVVTRDGHGKWIWKPQATGNIIKRLRDQNSRPKFRRWDHVAFAFHIPDELGNDITVGDPQSHRYEI